MNGEILRFNQASSLFPRKTILLALIYCNKSFSIVCLEILVVIVVVINIILWIHGID